MTTPPIDRWAGDGALHELARLARDLPTWMPTKPGGGWSG